MPGKHTTPKILSVNNLERRESRKNRRITRGVTRSLAHHGNAAKNAMYRAQIAREKEAGKAHANREKKTAAIYAAAAAAAAAAKGGRRTRRSSRTRRA